MLQSQLAHTGPKDPKSAELSKVHTTVNIQGARKHGEQNHKDKHLSRLQAMDPYRKEM